MSLRGQSASLVLRAAATIPAMAIVEPRPEGSHLRLVPPKEDEPAERESDREIVAALQRGERRIGSRLYDHLFPVVDRTLYRILGCREQDHADLVQAVFEQIVGTLAKRKFAGECSLAGWASVIACHVGLTALRSRRRERKVIERHAVPESTPEPLSPSADPERDLVARRSLERVREHLATMDNDRSTALLLHAIGYSLQEIAHLTSVTVAAAQSRLSRGRRELQTQFESDGFVPSPSAPPKGF